MLESGKTEASEVQGHHRESLTPLSILWQLLHIWTMGTEEPSMGGQHLPGMSLNFTRASMQVGKGRLVAGRVLAPLNTDQDLITQSG